MQQKWYQKALLLLTVAHIVLVLGYGSSYSPTGAGCLQTLRPGLHRPGREGKGPFLLLAEKYF